MRPLISEFSYGYAVTEELVRITPFLTSAPYFPSLYQEGQAGGGYDLQLNRSGIPLFVQFKLSHCMVRPKPEEISVGLEKPFYRMHLHPQGKSQQHNMLCELEEEGQEVYYIAPIFHTSAELDQHYSSQNVLQNSVFIRPLSIGRLEPFDFGVHHVAFRTATGNFTMFSTPSPMKGSFDMRSFMGNLSSKVNSRSVVNPLGIEIDNAFNKMSTILRGVNGMQRIWTQESFRGMDSLQHVAYLARTFFGCEILLLSEQS